MLEGVSGQPGDGLGAKGSGPWLGNQESSFVGRSIPLHRTAVVVRRRNSACPNGSPARHLYSVHSEVLNWLLGCPGVIGSPHPWPQVPAYTPAPAFQVFTPALDHYAKLHTIVGNSMFPPPPKLIRIAIPSPPRNLAIPTFTQPTAVTCPPWSCCAAWAAPCHPPAAQSPSSGPSTGAAEMSLTIRPAKPPRPPLSGYWMRVFPWTGERRWRRRRSGRRRRTRLGCACGWLGSGRSGRAAGRGGAGRGRRQEARGRRGRRRG